MKVIKLTKPQRKLLTNLLDAFRKDYTDCHFKSRTAKSLIRKGLIKTDKIFGLTFTGFGLDALKSAGIDANGGDLMYLKYIPVYQDYLKAFRTYRLSLSIPSNAVKNQTSLTLYIFKVEREKNSKFFEATCVINLILEISNKLMDRNSFIPEHLYVKD